MDCTAERIYLERVVAGKAKPTNSMAATAGRLAEIYLDQTQDETHPEAALDYLRVAIDAVERQEPLYPKLRHLEAMALRRIARPQTECENAWAQAAEIDRDVWPISLDTAPREAILFAIQWADWAWERDRWAEAGEAYSNALRAQYRFLRRQVASDADRLDLLEYSRFATRAAFSYGKLEKPKEAIIQLERSMDLVFGRQQQRRDLARLRIEHPEFAQRVESGQAAMLAYQKPGMDDFGLDSYGNLGNDAQRAQAALDEVVVATRALPGFATFALPTNWTDIEAAAAHALLVYLAPTEKGVAVFLVKYEGAQKSHVAIMLLDATTHDIGTAVRPFISAEFGRQSAVSRDALAEAMDYLGRHLMVHVRHAVAELAHGADPIALFPFGVLANLPLHTACIRDKDATTYLLHPRDVRLAYSSRALVDCFRRKDESLPRRALVINNPRPLPPAFEPLVLSNFETRLVARLVETTALSGEAATATRVWDDLPNAGLIHFSCHGTVAKQLKYSGAILLADRQMLTVVHLSASETLAARLVVLSACTSGTASPTMDHMLNLPAAFIAAGAAAVIGALWHSDEAASLLLMTRLYDAWFAGTHTPLRALGEAQAWLMSATAAQCVAALPERARRSPATRALREAGPDTTPYAHPWYWAGFFLAGA